MDPDREQCMGGKKGATKWERCENKPVALILLREGEDLFVLSVCPACWKSTKDVTRVNSNIEILADCPA